MENPDTTIRQYHYEDVNFPHLLTGITDERGIRYATYQYDEQGGVIASYHANDVNRIDISYVDSNTRILKNSTNETTTYAITQQLGVALVTNISGPGCSTCGTGNTSYQYDPANNNLLSKTENGVTTEYGNYDAKGQYGYKIEAKGTPEEHRTDYTYDNRFYNKITSITEPSVFPGNQKITTYTHDDWGNRTSETISGFDPVGNPVSRTTTWQYGGDGTPECDAVPLHQLCRVDGPRTDIEDITWYRYYPNDSSIPVGSRARLKEVEDANGVLIRSNIKYTATGKVASEDRPNGLRLTYSYYYGNDRLESLTETDTATGESRTTRWTYLPTGEVESITQGDGTPEAVTLYFGYDDARRLVRVTDGLGNYIEYTLDTEGNRLAEKTYDTAGTLKKAITQTFDPYNRLDTTAQANESVDYDFAPNGTLDQTTDGRGVITDYSYDALKRLVSATQDPGGTDPATADTAVTYGYDPAGNLTSVTDPVGGNTTYAYDDLGNLVSRTSPDTGTTSFRYDEAGNLIEKTDALGQVFTYSYDALNRLTRIDAPGTADDIEYVYDRCAKGVGRLCRVSTADGAVHYAYDAFGDITLHQAVRYEYDAAGRLQALTYPSGARVSYSYDAAGQVTQVDFQHGSLTRTLAQGVTHAPFGPVTAFTYGNGLTFSQSLDTAYRSLRRTVPGILDLDYTSTGYPEGYDANGNLLVRRDLVAGADTGFAYDALNRLDTADGPFGTRDYDYDKNGNRAQLTADGQATAYSYTSNSNRLNKIGATDVLLDANGNTLNQGLWTYAYTTHNRLKTATEDTTLRATFAYNGLGQRSQKTDAVTGRGKLFLYGTQGELLMEADADGNILTEYIYLDGELLALYRPDEDQDGTPNAEEPPENLPANLDSDGDGVLNRDEWLIHGSDSLDADTDGDGILDGEEIAQGTDPVYALSYPGDGDVNQNGEVNVGDLLLVTQMALKMRAPTPEQFVHADINRDGIIDVVDVLLLQRKILYPTGSAALDTGDETRLANKTEAVVPARAGIQTLLDYLIPLAHAAAGDPGQLYYVHNDHLGTPWAVTDDSGTKVWSVSYDPFGKATVDAGSMIEMNVRLPGQYYDQETGLHYNYFRYYDPRTGRYITADPLGLAGGVNIYTYALNNPLYWIDPYALDITVSFNPNAAAGFGHVGLGVNTLDTVGQRPQPSASSIRMALGLNVPGEISPDPTAPLSVTIPTTSEQDRNAQKCIETRTQQQQDYNLYNNNCTLFVRQCLGAAGINTPNTILPRTLFNDLQRNFAGNP